NTIGTAEVVLYSNPLTNAADSVNWTLVFANTLFGANSTVLPSVFPNYDNADHNSGTIDYIVKFGNGLTPVQPPFGFVPDVPQSTSMAANGWTNVLYMTVNKSGLGAEAGVNLYPQGVTFAGNYGMRFDMYLSLYDFGIDNP